MKRTLLTTIASLIFCTSILAQSQNGIWTGKQANNWHFGVAAGLSFNTIPPQAITNSAMEPGPFYADQPDNGSGIEGTGSISNENGDLLFYTNGIKVWNSNNDLMPNGVGLQGNASSTQSGLIVPMPGNSNLFYIFSIDSGNIDYPIVYSLVDMTLDNGLGDVTETKNIQIATGIQEKISAVYHADGEKVWVIIHDDITNEFKAFLISGEGINTTPVISSIGVELQYSSIGQMKFSPDGKKIARSGLSVGSFYVEVFNFNNETGVVENSIATLNSTDFPGELLGCYGIEFSPNSQLLYAASVFTAKIFQFNLLAGNEEDIKASVATIGQDNEFSNFSMQLAPDGKIYIARGNFGAPYTPYLGTQSTLNVINYPNNLGLASGFSQQAIDLADGRNDLSLPGFIQNYFASGILYDGQCVSKEITFSTVRIPDITAISWNFGDPGSGEANISSEGNHIFSAAGIYTVTALITSNNEEQLATVEIEILPAPITEVPTSDLAKCADSSGTATFNLSAFNDIILNGQSEPEFSVNYFASLNDLETDNAIATPESFVTEGQTIYARVLNVSTGCSETIQFGLVVNPLPIAQSPENLQECESTEGLAIFNLTSQDAVILGSNENFEVVYYTDENEAQLGENPITDAASFLSSGQTIYAIVTNPLTGCSATTQFDLIVLSAPFVDKLEFIGCAPFNLEDITTEKIGTDFTISYYTTEQDAISMTNSISNPTQFTITGNELTLFVLLENEFGCRVITQLILYKDNCQIQRGISPNGDAYNEVFDLSGLMVGELQIYNRYGTKVYGFSNYTNEWRGQSDKGEELPDGTYYYVITFTSGEETKTGWIYINRGH